MAVDGQQAPAAPRRRMTCRSQQSAGPALCSGRRFYPQEPLEGKVGPSSHHAASLSGGSGCPEKAAGAVRSPSSGRPLARPPTSLKGPKVS